MLTPSLAPLSPTVSLSLDRRRGSPDHVRRGRDVRGDRTDATGVTYVLHSLAADDRAGARRGHHGRWVLAGEGSRLARTPSSSGRDITRRRP